MDTTSPCSVWYSCCHWSVCFISTWASDLMLALRALSGKQSEVLCELIGWNVVCVSDFLLSRKLTQKPDLKRMEIECLHSFQHQTYVWDNVAIALHVDHGQVPAPPTPPSIETPEAFYKKAVWLISCLITAAVNWEELSPHPESPERKVLRSFSPGLNI